MMKSFLLGFAGYPMLEILYRGRTHYSMALAGGVSAIIIDRIRRIPGGLLSKAILCGTAVTAVEYVCGIIWNRQYEVWDYRKQPLNFQGQICLPYSLVWCALGACVMAAMQCLDSKKGTDR